MNLKPAYTLAFTVSLLLVPALHSTPTQQPASTSQSNSKHAASTAKAKPSAEAATSGDEGQRIFEQNCARCHNAPEGFSPRISATIVRHMRTRANLSAEEERQLLRFFNP